MKPHIYPSRGLPARLVTPGTLVSVATLVLVLALGACSKQEDKTAGQQVDTAIAKTEQSAAEATAKTESALASAGTAIKDAAQTAESSVKDATGNMGDKLDDVSITTSVSAEIAKDNDLSVLKINVDTKDGAVTLNGSAPTDAAREKAGSIAKAVKGVHSVDNKLVVKAS